MAFITKQLKNLQAFSVIAIFLYSLSIYVKFSGWDFDDSFIVFRVVQRIVDGLGWTYNNNDEINVSTSALNTMLLVILTKIGLSVKFAAHLLGSICIFIIGLALYNNLKIRLGTYLALSSALLFMNFISNNSSWGLESHLFIALFFVWIIHQNIYSVTNQATLGFLILARPDGFILYIISLLKAIWTKSDLKKFLLSSVWVLIVLFPWICFSINHFGQIFPDTLKQKMWQARSGFWGDPNYLYLRALVENLSHADLWGLNTMGIAMFSFLGFFNLLFTKSRLLYFVAFSIAQQFSYIILNVPGYHWYFINLNAAVVLLFLVGLNFVIRLVYRDAISHVKSYSHLRVAKHKLFAGFLLLLSLFVLRSLFLSQNEKAVDWRTVAYTNAVKMLSASQKNIESFSSLEVGVFGYLIPNAKVTDITGLINKNFEFLTGKNNDLFFDRPSQIVFLHDPINAMERGIAEDPRFFEEYMKLGISKSQNYSDIAIYKLNASFNDSLYEKKSSPIVSTTCDTQDSGMNISYSIDTINFGKYVKGSFIQYKKHDTFNVTGWVFDNKKAFNSINVSLKNVSTGVCYSVDVYKNSRPDLVQVYANNQLLAAGFTAYMKLSSLPEGDYEIYLTGIDQNRKTLKLETIISIAK